MLATKVVVASDRPWNRQLAARLARRCPGIAFRHIARRENLTPATLATVDPEFVFSALVAQDSGRDF